MKLLNTLATIADSTPSHKMQEAIVSEIEGQVNLVKKTFKWYLYGGLAVIVLIISVFGVVLYKLAML